MKTKEFKRRVEELGYFINDHLEYCGIKDADDKLITTIEKTMFLQFNIDYYYWEELNEIDKKELFDLLIEYAKTPIEDRKEEKKFYLRHKFLTNIGDIRREDSFINYDIRNNAIYLADKSSVGRVKTIFTLKEIEELKEKFNTDLADFELMEVEEWK